MAQGFLFLVSLILFSSTLPVHIHGCSEMERTSLLSFSLTLSSSPSLNWSTTSGNCCYWEGLTCNLDGYVTHLSLPSKGLKNNGDTLHLSSLQNLTHLTHLNLSHNSFHGSIDQIGHSSFLEVIDLSNNLLSGELPHFLLPTSIQVLDMSHNQFTGLILPSFFWHARNLTSFSVSNNNLSGPLPSYICHHFSSLISLLDFSFNAFSGGISRGLGQCSKLKIFRAGHNNVSGSIPEDIYNATTLEEIALPLGSLSGVISESIANLTNLSILNLYFNQLSGVLPSNIGKLSNLKVLLLHFNYFVGNLPPSLMNCTSLTEINFVNNTFGGDISTLDFSRLGKLTKLDLLKNNFTGHFPMSLYSCKSLKALRLSGNQIEGQIQPEILSLKSLSFLSLAYTRFTNLTRAMDILMHSKSLVFLSFSYGIVDTEESPFHFDMAADDGFENLQVLYLDGCGITGQVPTWLSKLKKLRVLGLQDNRITGLLPSWLGNLPRLFNLNLSFNQIVGEIPKEFFRLLMLTKAEVDADDHYLELPLYCTCDGKNGTGTFNNLRYLPSEIRLSSNVLSGIIPIEFGQLQLLQQLYLDSNNFSGHIPHQISQMKGLQMLDLSENRLSGEIPESLATLNFLSYFNVSYNNLEGPIPQSTQLQSFSASLFEGNLNLCGRPLLNECRETKDSETENDQNNKDIDNEHENLWLYVITAVGFFAGFWAVCGSLIFMKTWRYAYFRFIENVQDWLYVKTAVGIEKMKRRINAS